MVGVALKHRISWMLLAPPVEPAKPDRKLLGVVTPGCELLMLWLVMTPVQEPPLSLYFKLSSPDGVIFRSYRIGVALERA